MPRATTPGKYSTKVELTRVEPTRDELTRDDIDTLEHGDTLEEPRELLPKRPRTDNRISDEAYRDTLFVGDSPEDNNTNTAALYVSRFYLALPAS